MSARVKYGKSRGEIFTCPPVTPELQSELIQTWVAVTNSGGAGVGFLPPVSVSDVSPVAADLMEKVMRNDAHLIVARNEEQELLGWLAIVRNRDHTQNHWAWVKRMHVIAPYQGKGWGSAMLSAAIEICHSEGLAQVYLTTDGQSKSLKFYSSHGFSEVGRMPRNTLSMDGTFHDEVYMMMELGPGSGTLKTAMSASTGCER
ncbi:GNAT family N-acetyltransferase [Streptomyces sp. NBC_00233]|uniref:GNAT family N-acetyltransferase n=1 Tax=Streptomyces sp. NBC_00233 TaxID=2975686 RepID=UPI00224F75B5|nr:GNAT family N-acetyltransferase [Streptomyces sp. NBC_00233]MCX5233341.1 GNAT family N-acetyltransferase [Streptomyces sp. NBC_00233]